VLKVFFFLQSVKISIECANIYSSVQDHRQKFTMF